MTVQTEGNMGNKCIRQGYFNTDLSLYKSLLKNRLTLTLDVSDVFGTGNQHRTFYSGVQRTMLYDLNSTSTITFTSAIALTQRTASIKELVQVNLKRTECKVIKLKLRKRIKINLLQTESFLK